MNIINVWITIDKNYFLTEFIFNVVNKFGGTVYALFLLINDLIFMLNLF